MAARQQFLFSPERPIVDRLGAEFFRSLRASAGVYKMRDVAGEIIYIGKARNLRQRLRSYRVANPETLSRRHLRLLQRVARIEIELCDDESAALKHEAALIRSHRPKFNRAGVWPGKPQWLMWCCTRRTVEMCVREVTADGWKAVAAFKWKAHRLRSILARLLWVAADPGNSVRSLPCGWMNDRLPGVVSLELSRAEEVQAALENMFSTGCADRFVQWLAANVPASESVFETTVLADDVEQLTELVKPNTNLRFVEAGVKTAAREQFAFGADLGDFAGVQDDDPVGATRR